MQYIPAPDYRGDMKQLARLPVLQLFRMGHDTLRIAEIKGTHEGRVYNFLHKARNAERRQMEELREIR